MIRLWKIFLVFAKIGAFTIGGGIPMIAAIKSELVQRGWLNDEDFVDIITLAQTAPGLFAVNISILTGHRLRGTKGSVVATIASCLPPFLIILLVAMFFTSYKDNPYVAFCWDCGHENCFTPGWEFMPLFGNRLICTHIHDNMGTPKDEHMIPFDGSNDFARKAELLKKSGFEGSLMLELSRNSSDRYTDLSWEEYSQRAADAAKKLRAMVDGE